MIDEDKSKNRVNKNENDILIDPLESMKSNLGNIVEECIECYIEPGSQYTSELIEKHERFDGKQKNTSIQRSIDQRRKIKGILIAKKKNVSKSNSDWIVKGSHGAKHLVTVNSEGDYLCDCDDFRHRHYICKHIHAVNAIESGITLPSVHLLENKLNELRPHIKKCTQNWSAYNNAQKKEEELLYEILNKICSMIIEYPETKRGRPTVPIKDAIFAMVCKVYSMKSGRRATHNINLAYEKEYISRKVPPTTISDYMRMSDITPILTGLIELVSTPFIDIERVFAMDSSGFSTSTYETWRNFKYGMDSKKRKWLKAHINVGVITNIIAAVTITKSDEPDQNKFKHLFKATLKNFHIEEQMADGAYCTREIFKLIDDSGAKPFIPFTDNSSSKPRGVWIWKEMYDLFQENRLEYLKHYDKRNNVETTFHMLKTKFNGTLKSRSENGQVNEILCKILCHNISVLIHEIYQLNVSVDNLFQVEKQNIPSMHVVHNNGLHVNYSCAQSY